MNNINRQLVETFQNTHSSTIRLLSRIFCLEEKFREAIGHDFPGGGGGGGVRGMLRRKFFEMNMR